jgi:hypothetical protein
MTVPYSLVITVYNRERYLRTAIESRPLAKVKNLPPSVPPRLRGEARKIRLPDREFGEGWGGVWCIFARGLLLTCFEYTKPAANSTLLKKLSKNNRRKNLSTSNL